MSRMDAALRVSATALALLCTGFAQAELGGLYWGVHSSVIDETASYEKTVDNTGSGNKTSVKDLIFRSSDEKDGRVRAAGVLVGYRHSLNDFFVALQAEASYNFGASSGSLPASGISAAGNQLGEAWSEAWEVVSNSEFGAVAKFGREFSFLSFARFDIYALAGVKVSGLELDVEYKDVCLASEQCRADQLSSGSASYEVEQRVAIFGGGIERALTGSLSLSLEFRMESDLDATWTVLDTDDSITTTPEFESSRARLTATFNKYF